MYLATDYIHDYSEGAGVALRCRIRLYLPYEGADAAVVICSHLAGSSSTSVIDAAQQIAAEIIAHFKLPMPPVWIEHRPSETTGGEKEAFDLVTFAHYDVRKTFRGGTLRKEIGHPTRKPLDRRTVEMLVKQRV